MSSINPEQVRALTRFYEDYILPLSRRHRMEILDHTPPQSRASYFIKRTRTCLSRRDFEPSQGTKQVTSRMLDAHWAGTPLRGLGREILKLAHYFPEQEEKAELSSSIYEMF